MPNDIERIILLLADGVYKTRGEALRWINSPQRLLDGDTPRARIERGDSKAVIEVIEQFKSGAYI